MAATRLGPQKAVGIAGMIGVTMAAILASRWICHGSAVTADVPGKDRASAPQHRAL